MKLKKTLALTAILCLIAALSACAPAQAENAPSLTARGLDLIKTVNTLAESTEYVSLYSMDEEILRAVEEISVYDYAEPKAVFVLENLDKRLYESMLPGVSLSAEIEAIVRGKLSVAFASRLNAMNGVPTLTAASLLSHSDSFLHEGLQTTTTYLYTYDNGHSFTVTFVPDDDGIVNAAVSALINDKIAGCTTAEELVQFFRESLLLPDVSVSMAVE